MEQMDNTKAFTPRDYQIEILEEAKVKNVIACLGTGTGKTFIAVMLVKELSYQIREPYDQNGKRTIFLVPTVPLVHQQTQVLKEHTDLSVSGYHGGLGVDLWSKDKWLEEFRDNNILVMVAEVFRNVLDHGFTSLAKINLLVFDECHRAVKNHPYREIMRFFDVCPVEHYPRVLGLTASVLNGKCNPGKLEAHITNLEKTLRSCTLVSRNVTSVQEFGTKPKETLVIFKEQDENDFFSGPVKHVIKLLLVVQTLIDESKVEYDSDEPLLFDPLRDCKRYIVDVIDILKNMGTWCGKQAIKLYLGQLEKSINKEFDENNKLKLITIKSTLIKSLENLEKVTGSISKRSAILKHIPDKLLQLLKLLSSNLNNNDSTLCCIVFVQKRITAYMLSHWLNEVSTFNSYSDLKVNFVVGHGSVTNNISDLKINDKLNHKQDKVLKDFRAKKYNLLVASSVIEEGMDVPQCNLVVRFDPPTDYRSYTQSKGRARAKISRFVLMFPKADANTMHTQDLTDYKSIEAILLNICQDRELPDEEDIDLHMTDVLKPPYMPDKRCGAPRITMSSAIGLVNRYCSKLPGDAFTKLTPTWKIKDVNLEGDCKSSYRCTIKLPINSVIKDFIIGDDMPSKQLAKMAAALDVCKLLHQKGELDEHFLPVRHDIVSSDDEDEPMDYSEGKPGTKQKKTHYLRKIAPVLSGIPPTSTKNCHLYQIRMNLVELKPSQEELSDFLKFNPADFNKSFGLLTSNELPPLCDFDIFNKTGKINVRLEHCPDICLNQKQLDEIKRFQEHLFTEILDLESSLMIYDPLTAGFAYFITYLKKDSRNPNWNIDWELMAKVSKKREKLLESRQTGKKKAFKEADYQDSVLKPVYQIDNPHPCYVFKIRKDITPKSDFPKENYSTFENYYSEKYKKKIKDKSQPLVEVYYCDKPPLTVPNYLNRLGVVTSSANKSDKTILLVAEFCENLAVPGTMRRLAVLVPVILHRVNSLLQVEHLRRDICIQTGIGEKLIKNKCSSMEFNWILPDPRILSKKPKLEPRQFSYGELVEFSSPMDEDIISETYIGEPMDTERREDSISETISLKKLSKAPVINLDVQPGLIRNMQPKLKMLLSSITALNADDFLNLERLETVGDAFLKYATSMYCFHKHPDFDEGRLTSHKMKQISNKNLCKLGIIKDIPEIMIYSKFDPTVNWRAPGFKLPDGFLEAVIDLGVSSHHLMLPGKGNEIRNLSVEELTKLIVANKDRLKRCLDGEETPAQYTTDFSARSQSMQQIADKNIADCVESLIGSYVVSCGTHGALLFMTWLGLKVLPLRSEKDVNQGSAPLDAKYMKIPLPPSPLLTDTPDIRREMKKMLIGFESLEKTVGYKFKDKSYLLQAFTHSSYVGNTVTDCYQRLEFLGDAVLDCIITQHLYSDPKNFGPGELSDLRQALVNNIFFGMLAVKYGFHKHIRYASAGLLKLIGDFALKVRESTTKDLLEEIIIEEGNCQGAEEVEVPKVLGDVVESLAGAIFLDSGMSFETVWTVFHKLMEKELEHYRMNIPLNPVRQIMEKFPGKGQVEFLPPKLTSNGKVNVTVVVNSLKFCGFGQNKKSAKSTAAKRALKHFKSGVKN